MIDFLGPAYEFAARLCEHMAAEGYSVMLLGRVGTGKSIVKGMVRADLAHRVVTWNDPGAIASPPTAEVAYVLLSVPIGVSLHYALPAHQNGLEATVRARIHPGWLRD